MTKKKVEIKLLPNNLLFISVLQFKSVLAGPADCHDFSPYVSLLLVIPCAFVWRKLPSNDAAIYSYIVLRVILVIVDKMDHALNSASA